MEGALGGWELDEGDVGFEMDCKHYPVAEDWRMGEGPGDRFDDGLGDGSAQWLW